MKKNILKVLALSFALLLTGCDKAAAKPANKDSELVQFNDGSKYFQNNQSKIYDVLASSSTSNTTTLNKIVELIIQDKVDGSNFFQDLASLRADLVEEQLLKTLDSGSYKTDKLFSEAKFINSINSSLVKRIDVSKVATHEDILIKPDTEVKELLGEDYNSATSIYREYIDNQILPEINKKLLTAKFICESSFSSLGRAYARDVSYIKLSNMEKKPGAASQLINDWLGDFVKNKKTTTSSFDLDSLARIYKGVVTADLTTEELNFINDTKYYSLSDEIEDEIKKVCTIDPLSNKYTMKIDSEIDTTIEDKYTGSGTYTMAWGHELALRDLAAKKISDSGLYTKTNGISDLPDSVTSRLFSSSISSYTKGVKYTNGEGAEQEVKFLTPASFENGNELGQYYFFDSSSNAYYIVVVNNHSFTSTNIKDKVTHADAADKNSTVTSVPKDVARIAYDLSSSSSYSNDAMVEALKEYKIAENIHDQSFYDYMSDTYSELFSK